MPTRKKTARGSASAKNGIDTSYLDAMQRCAPFAQLDTKIARARTQDTPVLYAHVLPGLDLLLCSVRGAHPPYPDSAAARTFCLESLADAIEQALEGLSGGGYWYEDNGLGLLIFSSIARPRILEEFGALHILDRAESSLRFPR